MTRLADMLPFCCPSRPQTCWFIELFMCVIQYGQEVSILVIFGFCVCSMCLPRSPPPPGWFWVWVVVNMKAYNLDMWFKHSETSSWFLSDLALHMITQSFSACHCISIQTPAPKWELQWYLHYWVAFEKITRPKWSGWLCGTNGFFVLPNSPTYYLSWRLVCAVLWLVGC